MKVSPEKGSRPNKLNDYLNDGNRASHHLHILPLRPQLSAVAILARPSSRAVGILPERRLF
jgi:hypothetical protein